MLERSPVDRHTRTQKRSAGTLGGACAGAAVTVALLLPCAAQASELIGRDASAVRLRVDAQGRAAVTFRSEGRTKTVVAWGAVNARAPSQSRPQVAFQVHVGGAIGPSVCGRYRGPAIAWRVAACTAPDGTHWVVQAWQRMLPNYGATPAGERAAWELRLSHWSGPLARLELHTDWSYGRFDHLYGRLTYRGQAVHGFRVSRFGVPLDTYGRNVYVDTYASAYGAGWKRENSLLTHRPRGGFCYTLSPHAGRQAGSGTRYRATVIGPGVTPDVTWQGPAPGPYDPAADTRANADQRRLLGADPACTVN